VYAQGNIKFMNPGLPGGSLEGIKAGYAGSRGASLLRIALWLAIAALSIVKFFYLTADFPNDSAWMIDQAKYTDEGWWANAAVMHQLAGHWHVAGDYNPAVALPVWPILLGFLFHFTGVSIVAARALNVAISIATLGVVYLLVRRHTNEVPAAVAVLLLAASPFAFFFNRLAILDTLVIFEFCLLLLVASFASLRRLWPLVALPVLAADMMLTKTTAAVLLLAVVWMAWKAMDGKRSGLVRALLAVAVAPAALTVAYRGLVSALGYSGDYRYFFAANAMSPIVWSHTSATIVEFVQGCLWLDLSLWLSGLLILGASLIWMRKLWSNPLFASCWLALGGQAFFLFLRQEDFAPRYYLPMIAPLAMIAALALGELAGRARKTAAIFIVLLVVSCAANVASITQMLSQREYQFIDAANSIRQIVQNDPAQKQLLFGVSGSQVSLMTGIPSINDAYSTEDMAEKVARYQPGWYLAWNEVGDPEHTFLAPYRLEEVGRYPAFDDDERDVLILYKMVRK
jgi:4-amino-4-deoxy-L-arabinose transferase-like glycosyltransferase